MKRNRKVLVTFLIFYIVLLVALLILILPPAMDVLRYDLFEYWGAESLMIFLMTIIICLTALILMLFNVYNKNNIKEYTEVDKKVYMDDERSYLERQINEINKKLVSTDERWKEVYHLVMSSQDKHADKSGKISPSSFLKGFGIDIANIEIQGDLAFVLTPFHDDFAITYDIVCQTCRHLKLNPVRGDEEYIANDILKHIIRCMVKARLVIAILDGRNPNVFYELGIAHSLNKPTILLANVQTQIPFDLQNQFLVLYENENDLREKLVKALLNILTLS